MVDCGVCEIEPYKMLMHFFQFNHLSWFEHFNYFNQLSWIVQFVSLTVYASLTI